MRRGNLEGDDVGIFPHIQLACVISVTAQAEYKPIHLAFSLTGILSLWPPKLPRVTWTGQAQETDRTPRVWPTVHSLRHLWSSQSMTNLRALNTAPVKPLRLPYWDYFQMPIMAFSQQRPSTGEKHNSKHWLMRKKITPGPSAFLTHKLTFEEIRHDKKCLMCTKQQPFFRLPMTMQGLVSEHISPN